MKSENIFYEKICYKKVREKIKSHIWVLKMENDTLLRVGQ